MSPERPLVLIGAGNMGGAMLSGWLSSGVSPQSIHVVDPAPVETEALQSVTVDAAPPGRPAGVVVVAVKPHLVADLLPRLAGVIDERTMLISIAAGVTIERLMQSGAKAVVRAMPNTPASIGEGATVAVAKGADESAVAVADRLLRAVGQTWWVDDEALLDAVTAVSGSGPAYVFHFAECLAAAGVAAGLPRDLAEGIARQTVVGAGALLGRSTLDPGILCSNVTSKGGTTAAALGVLRDTGALEALVTKAVEAAANRSRELDR